jgi:PAS domain S-box-containing protein
VDDDASPAVTAFSSALLDSVSDLLVAFDRAGAVTHWNRAVTETTGHTDETLSSASVGDLFVDAAVVRERVVDAATGNGPFVARVRTADGDRVPYEFTATVHTHAAADADASDTGDTDAEDVEHVVCVGRAVTDPSDRRRGGDWYRTILESLPDAIYAIEADGTIAYVNEAYTAMKRATRGELLGTDIDDWIDDETVEQADELRRALDAGDRDVGAIEYEFVTADGERVPAEIRFREVNDDEFGFSRVGMIRDVSDRVERERQLQRQNDRLDEFAAIVSHDLRNPLNVAEGRLELAREECDSEHLASVERAHDRMWTLIDDLLTLARQGGDDLDPATVSLATLADRCWDSVEWSGATLAVETDAAVRADESRLQRLLENLFRNSVEHGSTNSRPEAGDSVEHGSTTPRSQAREDSVERGSTSDRPTTDRPVEDAGSDPSVTVTVGDLPDGFFVADDGPGIPAEVRDEAFEAGYSTNPEGTGFGLSIVREVADAHGWDVRLVDAEEGGARFEFRGVTVV